MDKSAGSKMPAYDWVDSLSGRLIVAFGTASSQLEGTYDRFFANWGLSLTKFNALLLLYKNEGMALWEIGEAMLVSRANITKMMDRLEASGLVTREINRQDRRSLTARLTAAAECLLAEILPQLKEFNDRVAQEMSQEELRQLIGLLEKLAAGAAKLTRETGRREKDVD